MYKLIIVALLVVLAGCATKSAAKAKKLFALHAQAEAFYNQRNYSEALPVYEKLARKLPDSADVWLRIGNCQARLMRPQEAVQSYRQAIARNPNYSKAWYNLSYVQAQMLAETARGMYANIDPSDPGGREIRELVLGVLEPFELAAAIKAQESAAEVLSSDQDSVLGAVEPAVSKDTVAEVESE